MGKQTGTYKRFQIARKAHEMVFNSISHQEMQVESIDEIQHTYYAEWL